MNDVERERIGEDGGDGVSGGGRTDVEGVGEEGGEERQDRSRSKSPNPSKILPRIAAAAGSVAEKRIVLSSS